MHDTNTARVHRLASGYCYEAPGVYLWDEDRSQVERAARDLEAGRRPSNPTSRMLIIPTQHIAAASNC
jgi:hypothetical protein